MSLYICEREGPKKLYSVLIKQVLLLLRVSRHIVFSFVSQWSNICEEIVQSSRFVIQYTYQNSSKHFWYIGSKFIFVLFFTIVAHYIYWWLKADLTSKYYSTTDWSSNYASTQWTKINFKSLQFTKKEKFAQKKKLIYKNFCIYFGLFFLQLHIFQIFCTNTGWVKTEESITSKVGSFWNKFCS